MTTATKSSLINPKIRAFIIESIYEALNDQERGLELTEETKRRLRVSKNKKQKTISLSEVRKKYY